MGKSNKRAESIQIGAEYGYWTVVQLASKTDYLECRCVCGTLKDVNVYSLLSGKSQSCGCRMKQLITETRYLRTRH